MTKSKSYKGRKALVALDCLADEMLKQVQNDRGRDIHKQRALHGLQPSLSSRTCFGTPQERVTACNNKMLNMFSLTKEKE